MVGEYPIQFADTIVGTAAVTREGMFFLIRCQGSGSADVPRVVVARWGEEKRELGLCGKASDGWSLTARLNRKHVPPGRPVFSIAVKHVGALEKFIPIVANEPFAYISELKRAFLVMKAGQPGILLKDQMDNDSPTGQ